MAWTTTTCIVPVAFLLAITAAGPAMGKDTLLVTADAPLVPLLPRNPGPAEDRQASRNKNECRSRRDDHYDPNGQDGNTEHRNRDALCQLVAVFDWIHRLNLNVVALNLKPFTLVFY